MNKGTIRYETLRLSLGATEAIEASMAKNGLSREAVAFRLGLKSLACVHKMLGGGANPTLKTLVKFGLACGFKWTLTCSPIETTEVP